MRTAARWGLPAAVTTVVVGGSFLLPSAASAVPELAPTTAEGLLTTLASATATPFSGTVVSDVDLGLPDLSGVVASSSDPTSLTNLVAGSTTARVWSDGASRSRIAVLGTLAETDVVRDGADVYTWRSGTGTVEHATAPTGAGSAGGTAPSAPAMPQLTPAQAAQAALSAVEPSTRVTLGASTTVAGRAARQLVLAPRDAGSLVGRVVLAVDATTSAPLRVQVYARGASDPAISTGFTSVSFTAPAADQVSPALPRGATVRDAVPHRSGAADGTAPAASAAAQGAGGAGRPAVVGTGWTAVVVVPGAAGAVGSSSAGALLQQASHPVSGAFGTGRLVSSALLSALVLDDGRVLVGAVGASALEAAATS